MERTRSIKTRLTAMNYQTVSVGRELDALRSEVIAAADAVQNILQSRSDHELPPRPEPSHKS